MDKLIGLLTGGDGDKGGKGYSRKWLAIVGAALLHFSGHPVPQEMWYAVGAYVIGQGIADKKS